MNQRPDSPHTHFHIRWDSTKHMDWECFDTYDSAVIRALELVLPGEGFAIKEISATCSLRGRSATTSRTHSKAT
jgi:hypothetical protein